MLYEHVEIKGSMSTKLINFKDIDLAVSILMTRYFKPSMIVFQALTL